MNFKALVLWFLLFPLDRGDNSSKGVLIDEEGKLIAKHSTQHSMTNPAPGHYEHDAESDWWGDFCIISKALIEKKRCRSKGHQSLRDQCFGSGLPACG